MYDISVALPSYIPWARTETHVELRKTRRESPPANGVYLRRDFNKVPTGVHVHLISPPSSNAQADNQRACTRNPPLPARSPKTEHITFIAKRGNTLYWRSRFSRSLSCSKQVRSIDLPFCGSIHHHLFVGVVFGKAFFGSLQDRRTSC